MVSGHDTVRYLRYEVGTGELVQPNWAMRLRRGCRRLLTDTTVAASVQHRMVILNVTVLPSVLFTSAVFDMPRWAHTELAQLYKRFLWQHASESEVCRHKINPALLVTPKQAGGVGLVSFEVDLKSQRTKLALRYILQ